MSEVVIAVYLPREGREAGLEALLREHTQILRRNGMITERPPVLLRSSSGAFLEIFEWVSSAAVEEAPNHPEVSRIWRALAEHAEFGSLDSLPEKSRSFPHFRPL